MRPSRLHGTLVEMTAVGPQRVLTPQQAPHEGHRGVAHEDPEHDDEGAEGNIMGNDARHRQGRQNTAER